MATSLAVFVTFLDVTIVNVAFPGIRASFPGTSTGALSWILNAYNIVFAALLLPAGRIADLYGRRRLFLIGLALFGLGSAACAAAPSVAGLVVARGLQAVGGAIIVPTSLALLLVVWPEDRRASVFAIPGAIAAVAASAGPALGGVLVEVGNWRLIFLVNLPIIAVTWLLSHRLLEESRDNQAHRLPDLLGVALLASGVALVALGLVEGNTWGWNAPRTLAALVAGTILVGLSARRSLTHPSPALELRLLRAPGAAVANIAALVFAVGFYAKMLCDIIFLTSVWGYSVLEAGLALTPGPIVAAATAATAGRFAVRFGPRRLIIAGALLYAAACVWAILVVGGQPQYVGQWLPLAFMTGIAIALAFPTLTSAAVQNLPAPRFAAGSAINATARQLGGVLGVAVLVAILEAGGGSRASFDRSWAFSAAMAGAASLIAIRLPRQV